MRIESLSIPDVLLIKPEVFNDKRGFFYESFSERHFPVPFTCVQENHSYSHQGVLRGLHYQVEPFSQSKLIQVMQGHIFDVAVDIRPDSPYFGQHISIELSASEPQFLYIPKGFAHGFVTLSKSAQICYKVDAFYDKASERGLLWNDPDLAIMWPCIPDFLSDKDKALALFRTYKEESCIF